jgi:type II secretory pathway pseudopilin PulG
MATNSGAQEDEDDIMKPVREKRFTLTELLVGTAILLIMMTMLFQILGTLTKGWSLARSNARVYERAQLVFDMVGRDFQTAIAGKQGGKDIYIWWGEGATFTDNKIVLASDPTNTLYSRLLTSNTAANTVHFHMISLMNEVSGEGPSEIHYCFDPDPLLGRTPTKGIIYRAVVKDNDANNQWDFLSNPNTWQSTPAWPPAALPQPQYYFPLIDGVKDFRIKVSYHNAGELPNAVMVSVTLIDTEGVAAATTPALKDKRILASQRSFTKVFFLGRDRRLGEPKSN